MEPCSIARRGIHFALSVFLLGLMACGGGGTIGPQNQPQVTNAVDDFQFQATNLNNVTQTIVYTWQNTGTQANVNQAAAITAGSATLPLGQTELEITAEAASDSAKILITPTTLTNQILTVVSKEIGKFKVAISASASADLKFDWFIVGN